MAQIDTRLYPIATKKRRRGLTFGGTARASGGTSLNSTMTAVAWDGSTYSNEVPLQVRFRTTAIGFRFTGELGAVASNAAARLVSGGGSTVYTSVVVSTWGEFEDVSGNYHETGSSHVLGYIKSSSTARAVPQYEVLTVPRSRT